MENGGRKISCRLINFCLLKLQIAFKPKQTAHPSNIQLLPPLLSTPSSLNFFISLHPLSHLPSLHMAFGCSRPWWATSHSCQQFQRIYWMSVRLWDTFFSKNIFVSVGVLLAGPSDIFKRLCVVQELKEQLYRGVPWTLMCYLKSLPVVLMQSTQRMKPLHTRTPISLP